MEYVIELQNTTFEHLHKRSNMLVISYQLCFLQKRFFSEINFLHNWTCKTKQNKTNKENFFGSTWI